MALTGEGEEVLRNRVRSFIYFSMTSRYVRCPTNGNRSEVVFSCRPHAHAAVTPVLTLLYNLRQTPFAVKLDPTASHVTFIRIF